MRVRIPNRFRIKIRLLRQPVAALQTEYSLMNRDPEKNGLLEVCEELEIGFVPWGPIGMGYLTQKLSEAHGRKYRDDPKMQRSLRSGVAVGALEEPECRDQR